MAIFSYHCVRCALRLTLHLTLPVTITYDDDDELFSASKPIIALRGWCFAEVIALGIGEDPSPGASMTTVPVVSLILDKLIFQPGRGAEDLIKFCAIIVRRPKALCARTLLLLNRSSTLSDLCETIQTRSRGALCKRRGFSHVRESLRVFIRDSGVRGALPPEQCLVAIPSGRN